MTKITIYDYEAELIEKLCEKYDTTEAEIICAVFGNLTVDDIEEILS